MYGCDDFSALLDLFLDGELAPDEMVRVQEHLDACPDCQHYIEDALEMRAAFPSIEDTVVPEGFADDVMRKIRAGAPKRIAFPRRWMGFAATLAACCAIVVLLRAGPMGMNAGRSADMAAVTSAEPQQKEAVCGDVLEEKEEAAYDTGGDSGGVPAYTHSNDAVPESAPNAATEDDMDTQTAGASEIVPRLRSTPEEDSQYNEGISVLSDIPDLAKEAAPVEEEQSPEEAASGAGANDEPAEAPLLMTAPTAASAKMDVPDLVLTSGEAGDLLDGFTPIEDDGEKRTYLLTREEFAGVLEMLPVKFELDDDKETVTLIVTTA